MVFAEEWSKLTLIIIFVPVQKCVKLSALTSSKNQ